MDPVLSRAALLVSDPGELFLFLINLCAAAVVIARAFRRVQAMCCCTPHGVRIAACVMAAGAVAVMLSAVEGSIPLSWPQTILLGGVAMHCLFDRREAPRRAVTGAIAAAQNAAGA